MTPARICLFCLAVAVGGCDTVDLDFLSQPEQKPASTSGPVKKLKTVSDEPADSTALFNDQPGDLQTSAVPDSPAPIEVNDDPDQFLEKDGLAVNAALGAPGFIRRDGPAEVWQYSGYKNGIECILDVYLYTDASNADSLWVKYVELRGASATRVQRRACFADMLRRQIQTTAG